MVRRYETTLTDRPRRHASIVRGAVVGGSGAVNGGYFCRGLPDDFDGWGIPGWSWADVLPHFKDIETDLDFGGPRHGADGPDGDQAHHRIRRGAQLLSSMPRSVGATNGSPTSTAAAGRPGVAAVPLNIDRGARVWGRGTPSSGRAAGRPNLDRAWRSTGVQRIR